MITDEQIEFLLGKKLGSMNIDIVDMAKDLKSARAELNDVRKLLEEGDGGYVVTGADCNGMDLGGRSGLASARMDQRQFYQERCNELEGDVLQLKANCHVKDQLLKEIEELKGLLPDILNILEKTQDEGPEGGGWKSDALEELISKIRSAINKSKP